MDYSGKVQTQNEKIRIFVGADRSQFLAVKVLEHSIRRHSSVPVEVRPMLDLPIREPKDVKQRQRTGFSFSRFCIPEMAGFSGRAIYMDADMLVFKDISELWNWPFGSFKILLQKKLEGAQKEKNKIGAPEKRIRQCAVMLIDCESNQWRINEIIDDLDHNKYTYENLMFELCLLKDHEIGEVLPFEWNSLEHWDQETRLIHYTDMNTQPWVNPLNPFGDKWFAEVRLMLKNGSLSMAEIKNEIHLGYFRPSLLMEILFGNKLPRFAKSWFNNLQLALDKFLRYKPHVKVYALKAQRDQLIRAQQPQ